MNLKLSEWAQSIWYSKRGVVAWLLWPLSLLYQLIVLARKILFRLKFLPTYEPLVPVVVIGNMTVGGVGKTPFVAALAKHLVASGQRVGIVSRGYGGRVKVGAHVVTADSDPADCGDEPVMLAQQVNAVVVVAAKRVAAIQLCEEKRCDVILSDDGLSHYYFQRHSEYVLMDAARGWGNGFCLPAGPLREPVSRLQSVTEVLKNTVDAEQPDEFCLQPVEFVCVQTGATRLLDSFSGQKVHAVSAIGNNQRFFDTLTRLGCDITKHGYPDHHAYNGSEWLFSDDLPVVMTEKDAIKVKNLPLKNAWFLRIEAVLHPLVYKELDKCLQYSQTCC